MTQILIIEDERIPRKMMRAMLEQEGFDVSEAGDGEEGLRLYADRRADVVITDIFMPNKEGVETVRDLLHEDPEAKIIAVTGGGTYTIYEPLLWVRAMGVCHTFTKPVDRDVLLAAVSSLIEA